MQTPRAEMKLNFERDKLVNKLQQLQSDMSVGRIILASLSNPTARKRPSRDSRKRLMRHMSGSESLEKKIRILDDMENEN